MVLRRKLKRKPKPRNLEDRDMQTDVKMQSRKTENGILWSKKDEEMRLAYSKRVKNNRKKPSMWEYDPKGGLPTELANLDPSTFSTKRQGQILCSLPRDVLVRLCSMLPARTFINLSSTCRFLHWRMFTFCTCYVPYSVRMIVSDYLMSDEKERKKKQLDIPPKVTYTLNMDILKEEKEKGDDGSDLRVSHYVSRQKGRRGLFVYQPFCIRKPFIFDTLILQLYFPFYCKHYYDRCLPYIMAVRGFGRHFDLLFIQEFDFSKKPFINYSATSDFLKAINPSYYDNLYNQSLDENAIEGIRCNADIYINCPYARQMNRVFIFDQSGRLDVPIHENRIGVYWTRDSAAIATLKKFLAGSKNLIYHQYAAIQIENGRFPLMEYLFEEIGVFEKFSCKEKDEKTLKYHSCDIWKKVVETKNGGLLRIMIDNHQNNMVHVRIGKEELFEEMDRKYAIHSLYQKDNIKWNVQQQVGKAAMEKKKVEKWHQYEEWDFQPIHGPPTDICNFCSIL